MSDEPTPREFEAVHKLAESVKNATQSGAHSPHVGFAANDAGTFRLSICDGSHALEIELEIELDAEAGFKLGVLMARACVMRILRDGGPMPDVPS